MNGLAQELDRERGRRERAEEDLRRLLRKVESLTRRKGAGDVQRALQLFW